MISIINEHLVFSLITRHKVKYLITHLQLQGTVPNADQSGCNECPAGQYRDSTVDVCTNCPTPKYSANTATPTCLICDEVSNLNANSSFS